MSSAKIFPNDSCIYKFTGALGDGFCHDELNTEECNFDGGDCCLETVYTNVCEKCECKGASNNGENIIRMKCKYDCFDFSQKSRQGKRKLATWPAKKSWNRWMYAKMSSMCLNAVTLMANVVARRNCIFVMNANAKIHATRPKEVQLLK